MDNGKDGNIMFDFRIIDTADGNQIIDRNLKRHIMHLLRFR